jgi:hypothetical protein
MKIINEKYSVKNIIKEKLVHSSGQLKVSLVSIEKKRSILVTAKGTPPKGESIEIQSSDNSQYRVWIKKDSISRFVECFFKILNHAKWNEFENPDILLPLLKSKKVDKKILEELMQKPENFAHLKNFIENDLTTEDVIAIGYRKKQLKIFDEMLKNNLIESDWQKFFEKNEWIFGYGLDYRFIESSNREVDVGYGAIDFASFNKFSVLVEIKTPQTSLLKNAKNQKSPNRVDAWSLSEELIEATSQILAYKANWQIEQESRKNKEKYGDNFLTADPKAILVIGKFCDLDKNVSDLKNKRITKETFELFRRDSRNIEIITFDELYERARFIVDGKKKVATLNSSQKKELCR